MAPHTVFVCSATGCQGGAVARQLRAIGWEVHTTTRNTDSPSAQALASIGVKVHAGDWNDGEALESAFAGCDLLFLNLMPDLNNFPAEFEQGQNVLRIAKAAGVTHVVYSSALDIPPGKSNPLREKAFKSKRDLEQYLPGAGFQHWTVLQPGFFMANLLSPKVNFMYPGAAEAGCYTVVWGPDTPLPMIDHEDIAAFVVAAFQQPNKFHGQHITLVSEMVPFGRALDMMARATGKNIHARYLKDDEVEEAMATNPMLALQQTIKQIPVSEATDGKSWGVAMGTFERFVERERKDFLETYRSVEALKE
ncbi:uncharacterized protein B0T15DRAFT_403191 [Chaetomium strumarium]|uniref:NmrA-like domain-containing protein n=1 Tax=Chaetomium strumarium TaxID=1170767 RepID=A0AAJ0GMH0_9PEZI|nr:hypothetical protein B0T15DRAFT_403191 [Chaetomium strumarium]